MNAISRRLPTIARLALGLIFFVFGLNGFFHFLPQPPAPPRAMAFAGALFASGYFFPLLKAVEVTAGALLLAGALVPFALTLLAPIIVNIVAFHLFLAPGNYAVVGIVLAAENLPRRRAPRGLRAALRAPRRARPGDGGRSRPCAGRGARGLGEPAPRLADDRAKSRDARDCLAPLIAFRRIIARAGRGRESVVSAGVAGQRKGRVMAEIIGARADAGRMRSTFAK